MFTLLVVLVSQPSVDSVLQSSQGGAHAAISQTVFEHVGVACAAVHTVPQAPQFWVLLPRFVSHPFVLPASQLPKPLAQGPRSHDELTHNGVALAYEQACVHAPQCKGSIDRLTSHPFTSWLSQLANGV